ncbi:MAG: hypothetical protein C4297_07590 [Gemmataceae bacterium]
MQPTDPQADATRWPVVRCPRCGVAQPSGARYCHSDGEPLPGIAPAAENDADVFFSVPFVFPWGRQARTLHELALGFCDDWETSVHLVREGLLATFFAQALGRDDLAELAQTAAQIADGSQALDWLLDKLPVHLSGPQLSVEPLHVHLGQLARDGQTHFDLHIVNQGLRLLRGRVTIEDTAWLSLAAEEPVQCRDFTCERELTVTVYARGAQMPAGAACQGRLLVDSNGGQAGVRVLASVPVVPYPSGVLAGARSPRQLAKLACGHPGRAWTDFASGAVAAWFAQNGWSYPVRPPYANGLAAVQQFLEAAGLVRTPRIKLLTKGIVVRAPAGRTFPIRVRLRALDAKPIYVRAECAVPWITLGEPLLTGRRAVVPVSVTVPECAPGTTLAAHIDLYANGATHFQVPVRVTVRESEDTGNRAWSVAGTLEQRQPIPVEWSGAPAGEGIWRP